MQMAATGPDGTNMGINEELILELEIQSNQVSLPIRCSSSCRKTRGRSKPFGQALPRFVRK